MRSEVKGTWFVTFRGWARTHLPAGAVDLLAADMAEYGPVILEPLQGDWYPEAALCELLEALFRYAEHDAARFEAFSRDVSIEGVGRFFRTVLSLTSTRFLLRQIPTMWSRLRRFDSARVEVREHPRGSVVHYQDFPWFRHEVYVHFTRGSLLALAQLSGRGTAHVEVLSKGPTHAEFLVGHR